MRLEIPDKLDAKEACKIYDRLSAFCITLNRTMPAFIKLLPAFKSLIKSIDKLMPEKIKYDE